MDANFRKLQPTVDWTHTVDWSHTRESFYQGCRLDAHYREFLPTVDWSHTTGSYNQL